jgi:HEAT repeat protein
VVGPLLAALPTLEAPARVVALRTLARLGGEGTLEPLTAALREGTAEEREAVLEALADRGDERLLRPLLDLLRAEDSLAADVTGALAAIGEPAVESLLAELSTASNRTHTLAALIIQSRAAFETSPRRLELLLTLLESPAKPARKRMAELLGTLGDPRAVEPLVARLADPEAEVRAVVATTLGKLEDPAAGPGLLALVRNEAEDEAVRVAAATALGAVGHPEAAATLLALLDGPNQALKLAAVEGLGALGAPETLDRVLPLVDGEDEGMTASALFALAGFTDERAVARLTRALVEMTIEDDLAGVVPDLLARQGSPQAVPALVARLRDSEWLKYYRFDTAIALARLTGRWVPPEHPEELDGGPPLPAPAP